MSLPETHGSRAPGYLPALLLWLVALLAAAYGPLANGASFASFPTAISGGVDAARQQSAPANHKRAFVVLEARLAKTAASYHDGGVKAALPPAGSNIPEPGFEWRLDTPLLAAEIRLLVHGYRAQAPPALS